ncbi:hypothetical protein BdWA1_000694 [Babesia duncani]|uniref:Uncharacterized protein n=1 Tax=Babesia duncani TaxID=323732 RepID=A0AAD9PN94_9APIC|nr:hypothetical protein BdWA1_000694 [Babesia duncani]
MKRLHILRNAIAFQRFNAVTSLAYNSKSRANQWPPKSLFFSRGLQWASVAYAPTRDAFVIQNRFVNTNVNAEELALVSSDEEFQEIMQHEDIWRLTAAYWRSLRFKKPLVITCNVDKAIESRMNDCILACGASCLNTSSIKSLHQQIQVAKQSQEHFGCYIILGNLIGEDMGESLQDIGKDTSHIIVDVVNSSDCDYTKQANMISAIKPQVIIFSNGTIPFLTNVDIENPVLQQTADKDESRIKRCKILALMFDATIIDNGEFCSTIIYKTDGPPIVVTPCGSSAVMFPQTLDILTKIYGLSWGCMQCVGYSICSGAIIASMISMASNQDLFASIGAIAGLDYVANESSNVAKGPGTMVRFPHISECFQFTSLIDTLHTLSKAPDVVQAYSSRVKFFKAKQSN